MLVRYNPDAHPNRVAPIVAPPRAVPVFTPAPVPAPVPVPAPTAPVTEATMAGLGAMAAELGVTEAGLGATAAPTLTAAQIADGVRVVSIAKPQMWSRLGITLTSENDALLHISTLAPEALGSTVRSIVPSLRAAHAATHRFRSPSACSGLSAGLKRSAIAAWMPKRGCGGAPAQGPGRRFHSL